ncbi:Hypothetical_protein [Hexamita inflata]|uniref:Hypothetical_protein n=1 Tax=Hexamita inflata TaxID=28002 RepID=A0AA86QYB2_9EUKA|nr:Hypothetical protein HINF_LOCUS49673 [Hexamita inflata]
MRQKFTQEQNEAFYLAAAKMFQEAFGANNCISPSGQVVKEVFFAAYRDRFGYGLGLFKTKEEAKRMRDGITKFFKARFVEKMERYTSKGVEVDQILSKVISEFEPFMMTSDIQSAIQIFKKSLDKQIVEMQNLQPKSPQEQVRSLNAQIQRQILLQQTRSDKDQLYVAPQQSIPVVNSHLLENQNASVGNDFDLVAKLLRFQ